MNDEEKIAALKIIIDDLCIQEYTHNEDNILNTIQTLKQIYADNFRHSYAEIFNKLQGVFKQDFEVSITLGENLNALDRVIRDLILTGECLQDTYNGFRKFSDHINLEIGRYNFIKNIMENEIKKESQTINPSDIEVLTKKIEDTQNAVNKIRPIATKAEKELAGLDKKLDNNKVSSITTLTIFSAVVLAFSGGISFEAGVFKGLSDVSSFRLTFIVALTGFILFNTIFVLLYIVGRMTGKTVSSKCKYLSLNKNDTNQIRFCGDGVCTKQCAGVSVACRIWHKYSYILLINIVLVVTMYETFILWTFKPWPGILLLSYIQCLLLSAPIIVSALVYILILWYKRIQRHRIVYDLKVNIIGGFLNSDERSPIFTAAKTVIDTLLLRINGRRPDLTDALESMISDLKLSDKKLFGKKLRQIDHYIKNKLIKTEHWEKTISATQHRQNIQTWKDIKTKLGSHLRTNIKPSELTTCES